MKARYSKNSSKTNWSTLRVYLIVWFSNRFLFCITLHGNTEFFEVQQGKAINRGHTHGGP